MVYRARFLWVYAFPLFPIVLQAVANFYFTWKRSGFDNLWPLAIPIVVEVLAFTYFALLAFASRYEIDGDKLWVRKGLIQQAVLLRDITSVYVPALSAKPTTSNFTTRRLRIEAGDLAMSCAVPQDEKGGGCHRKNPSRRREAGTVSPYAGPVIAPAGEPLFLPCPP